MTRPHCGPNVSCDRTLQVAPDGALLISGRPGRGDLSRQLYRRRVRGATSLGQGPRRGPQALAIDRGQLCELHTDASSRYVVLHDAPPQTISSVVPGRLKRSPTRVPTSKLSLTSRNAPPAPSTVTTQGIGVDRPIWPYHTSDKMTVSPPSPTRGYCLAFGPSDIG